MKHVVEYDEDGNVHLGAPVGKCQHDGGSGHHWDCLECVQLDTEAELAAQAADIEE